MLAKFGFVFSFIMALVCAGCAGICIFNLDAPVDYLWIVIFALISFALLAIGFVYGGLLFFRGYIEEQLEEDY